MSSKNKKTWIAVSIMLFGIIGFFISMTMLNVWGKTIEQVPIRTFIGMSFLALGLGGGLGFLLGGIKTAVKFFLYIILFFISLGVLGKILRLFFQGEAIKPFANIIGMILMVYGIQWAVRKSGLRKSAR